MNFSSSRGKPLGSVEPLRFAFDRIEDGLVRPNGLDDANWAKRNDKYAFGNASFTISSSPQVPRGYLRFLSVYQPSEFDEQIEILTPQQASRSDDLWYYPMAIRSYEFADENKPSPLDAIPESALRALRSSNSMILLDHSSEGILYDPSRNARPWAIAERTRTWCAKNGYDLRRVLVVMPNNRIDLFKGQGVKPLHFCYSLANIPALYAKNINDDSKFLQPDQIEASFSKGETRPYHFLTFNRRPRASRFCLVFGIMHAGLRDKGLVSFPQVDLQSFRDNLTRSPKRLSPAKSPMQDLLEKFDAYYERLPLNIDYDFSVKTAQTSTEPRRLNVTAMDSDHYRNSYFSIVTETNFDDGIESRFTEKTWKPTVNLHPFILVGSPGALDEFKDLGFRSFEPWIDETYDTLRDPNERMIAILEEVKRLCALSLEEMNAFYRGLWPTLLHNRQRCFEAGQEAKDAFRDKLQVYSSVLKSPAHA